MKRSSSPDGMDGMTDQDGGKLKAVDVRGDEKNQDDLQLLVLCPRKLEKGTESETEEAVRRSSRSKKKKRVWSPPLPQEVVAVVHAEDDEVGENESDQDEAKEDDLQSYAERIRLSKYPSRGKGKPWEKIHVSPTVSAFEKWMEEKG